MPKKEAVVLILDANESMTAQVSTEADKSSVDTNDPPSSPKTRFDCAKEACIAIISDLMVRSKTNEVTVVILHTEKTNNHFFVEDDSDIDDDEVDSDDEEKSCPFPNITEISGNGEVMGIKQPLPDLLRKIHELKPTAKNLSRHTNSNGGDFESGLVYAADALHRRTAGKQFDRRIVLLTDAEHRVGNTDDGDESDETGTASKMVSQQRLLVALDSLRAMECRIQVVGMDFKNAADFDNNKKQTGGENNNVIDHNDDDSFCEHDSDIDDDDEDDILEVKRENEEYLIQLANKTGGFVFASKEIKDILQKVLGSRVVQNPSKRKLVVEIAPGLVLEDARYYKLISKTGSIPLKRKLAMVEQGSGNETQNEVRKNALGEEMLQDYETTITHWNAEDENEELLWERIAYAYRFGSDLLPFSPLDEVGLTQRSPIKLTVLGYVPESSIPHYLRIDSPYVLTGNESRRCCAAISALARGLQRTEQVAIATFVKGVDKDPILCGLFPLVEKKNETGERNSTGQSSDQEPLRLIIVQLPFSGDVRYPHLNFSDDKSVDENDADDSQKPSQRSICCDDLIEKLMLPKDTLDHEHIPNHKVRSFYKTIVKRVLDKQCDVVETRIDPTSGIDSMDTPLEIRKQAQPAVAAFYEAFHLAQESP